MVPTQLSLGSIYGGTSTRLDGTDVDINTSQVVAKVAP